MNLEKELSKIKSREDIIREHKRVIGEQNIQINLIGQKIAEFLCPFVVGERVLNAEGKIEIIHSILYTGAPNKYNSGYNFKVKRIKKDGTPYKDSSHVWNSEKYSKTIPTI